MKSLLIILVLIISVVLQTTLFPFISFLGVIPNLVLVLCLFLAIWKKYEKVWWIILLTGLFADLLSGLPLGLWSLSLITTIYLIDKFNRSVFSGVKFWVMSSLIFLGTLVYSLSLFFLSGVFQIELVFSFKYLLIGVGYNLAILGISYAGIKKIFC